MSIVINKDGKQLGPYSLEQARALVLEGTIDADDWAWPDGATEWMQLRDVPGFAAAKAPTAPPAQPPVAVSHQEEEELWRGHPSQILNLHVYLFWGVILAAVLIAALIFADNAWWALAIFAVVAVVAFGQSTWAFFHLRMIEYIITTQRVRVISGLFSKEVQEIELFRVKDTAARQAFLLRLFGLGTITVLSGDEKQPRLVLDGVPRAIEMRERLRQEVLTLRQRFGVRELDVM
ncbi:MAG TPA: PH domain-containing protein [Candidatus Methylacidiphilales bacterium]|jgi:membrane protein YdbS with pleckstrin-like domain|nr:PH domain-containing protein [Candidatus Methylacidiphilales bacterium]